MVRGRALARSSPGDHPSIRQPARLLRAAPSARKKSARDALVPCPKSSKSTALNPPRCAAHGDVGPLRKRARGARAHARRLHRRGARGHGGGRVPVLVRGRRGGARTSAGG
eukprot:scaffold86788_cov65-Phaeocystis_antarctica.AAC.1